MRKLSTVNKALPSSLIYAFLISGIGIIGISVKLDISASWVGAYFLTFCIFYGYYTFKPQNRYLKLVLGCVAALFATAVGLHLFGSPSWQIASHQLSERSPSFHIYYNFDKLFIAICILLLWDGMKEMKWIDRQIFPVFFISCLLISMVGMSINYLAFNPKVVPLSFFALWAFKNLLLVVLPEELFFRGFIQHELGSWNRAGAWVIASLLFGIAHIGGGISYVLLCTLAGLMYGWLYLRTGNIIISILAHFFLNTLHIIFFTYPFLMR